MKVLRLDSSGVLREVNVSGDFGGVNFYQETRPATLAEVTQGFINLLAEPVANSVFFSVDSVAQMEGADYQIEASSGIFRLVFLGDLAAGGLTAIEPGDLISILHAVEPIAPTTVFQKVNFTLTSADILAQSVNLPNKPLDLSTKIISSGLIFSEDYDYTLEDAGTFTRVKFSGDLAEFGPAALEVGDVLQVLYAANV